MRQDDARDADGRCDGRHPGDRPVGRSDAQRLLQQRTRRIGHRRLVRPPGAGGRAHRLRAIPRDGRLRRAFGRSLQHDGNRAVHEQRRRGAGHVAARLRRDSRPLPRARPDGLLDRSTHRRDGARGPAALEDPDPQGLRERDRRGKRAGRLDQLPAARHRDRAPHGRAARDRRLGPHRLPDPPAGEPDARGPVPGRRVPSRRRACRR